MLLTLLSLLSAGPAQPPHRFVFLGAGRFAQFADMASLRPEGSGGRIRVFQVVEPDFRAGGAAYWGGWSWWRFDCDASQVDRLDFASVREGGEEGPATPDAAPAYEAAQGGDAFEILVAACNPEDQGTDAGTLEEAVAHGRMNLAAGG
ncbi:hypothetical protein GCM10007859_06750 [Brevundimonas denitrificans]|uniref:Uncharacterized protein n=1 Tax=Brevundimonas denitrificans TaxID=1443434 RepID=A0ABQ6BKC4_9CAUL|nr:hypothetical protein [Brevundimonas denitrificans]GLS00667.1 hypothetical protein GCM10007859_06750 [Brevundimonas denitrificans]